MDDIASEVGLSRPSVYRYFADRDDLLIELNIRHARGRCSTGHTSPCPGQSNFPDQIIEGLLYVADHGRRDPPDPVRDRSRRHEPGPPNDRFGNVGDAQS